MKLHFITSNEGKMKEAQAILGFPISISKLDLDEIQELDLEKIVVHKVKQAFEAVKEPVFVDDVGLFVSAWNGFPGPFIKYLREAGGNELLLRMMTHEDDRSVVAKAAIGYHDGREIHTFIGEVNGEIVRKPRGTNSWGWDPIFQPKGHDQTFSEMTEEMKNNTSHRRAALEKFKQHLRNSA